MGCVGVTPGSNCLAATLAAYLVSWAVGEFGRAGCPVRADSAVLEKEAIVRVAVLADIHGNLPALEAVLADVETAGVDAIVLNGDLADGPMPAQTLDRLEELGEQAIWVRGNTDRCLADAFDGTFQPSGLPAARRMVRLVRGQNRASSPGPAR